MCSLIAEQPRSLNRVPPGGKDSVIISDKFTPMKPYVSTKARPQDIDHIVFSEKDSIPHSTYNSPARFHRAKDSFGPLVHDADHVPLPICRAERKKVVNCPKAGMGNILNHEVPQIIPHRGRAHIPGRQTFTLA